MCGDSAVDTALELKVTRRKENCVMSANGRGSFGTVPVGGALVLLHTQTHTERETTLVFRGLSAGLIGQGTPQSIYTGRPSRRAKNHTIATIIMAVHFVDSSLPVRWGAVTDSRRDWH